jgi:hypothetical protein
MVQSWILLEWRRYSALLVLFEVSADENSPLAFPKRTSVTLFFSKKEPASNATSAQQRNPAGHNQLLHFAALSLGCLSYP